MRLGIEPSGIVYARPKAAPSGIGRKRRSLLRVYPNEYSYTSTSERYSSGVRSKGMVALKNAGRQADIARKLGVSQGTVRKWGAGNEPEYYGPIS